MVAATPTVAPALVPGADLLVRRAEPRDEARLIALLERHVTTRNAAARFDWLYRRNPAGPAVTWLALEPGHGDIVGWTTIFPRDFYIDGRMVPGSVGCDAFVLPEHRRRGIAVALHRASRAAMVHGEVPFRFMCGPPVPNKLSALVKAGSRVVGEMRYLGLPLTARGV